jgi:hypothetical protein
MTDEEILSEARDKFKEAQDCENDTREEALDDLKFARLGEQWPDHIRDERERDFRPCLTKNRLPTFIRQVVNDVRQNKPSIVVHPADDGADKETADIYNGLIRNIQVSSDADVATDTATESAVSNGFGYFRIDISDDGRDIEFRRIANPFSVFRDPDSEAADSSDWDRCWVVTMLSKDKFEGAYKNAEAIDWQAEGYTGLTSPWYEGDQVMVAEYWRREALTIPTVTLSNGSVKRADEIDPFELAMKGIEVIETGEAPSHKVTQYVLTGKEILETNEWPGKYIPIIPVYGDEINIEGKRYFRSLINPAKDAQRMFNYWDTMATELVALAPKAPYIGEEGAFEIDPRWSTANQINHPYLEYKKGHQMPQRQQFPSFPVGVMEMALRSADDMKAIIGLHDASLGARSNETSGVAIRARQAEGDVSTFHFIDNLSRAIRHAGRILIDLIPKVYNRTRIVRILGEDMKPQNVRIQPGAPPQEEQQQAQEMGEAIERVYDLDAGKYDLVVKAGPSYSTLREETRAELVDIIRSVPESASILGPMYLRHSDWPGAEDAADKLEQGREGVSPEHQKQMQQMAEQLRQAQEATGENEVKMAELQLKNRELDIKERELSIKEIEARAKVYSAANVGQPATELYREVA